MSRGTAIGTNSFPVNLNSESRSLWLMNRSSPIMRKCEICQPSEIKKAFTYHPKKMKDSNPISENFLSAVNKITLYLAPIKP